MSVYNKEIESRVVRTRVVSGIYIKIIKGTFHHTCVTTSCQTFSGEKYDVIIYITPTASECYPISPLAQSVARKRIAVVT